MVRIAECHNKEISSQSFFEKNGEKFGGFRKWLYFCSRNGALAHLVERNTGSVEVSGSSPLCSTLDKWLSDCFMVWQFFCPP